jgi:hypothetical protein
VDISCSNGLIHVSYMVVSTIGCYGIKCYARKEYNLAFSISP